MTKVLLVQRVLSHYNIPLYESIGKSCDLTVVYTEKSEDWNDKLHSKRIEYPTGKEWKDMSDEMVDFHVNQFSEICSRYDVAILQMEAHRKILHVIEGLRKYVKVILWGIGVSAGYDLRYDKQELRRPSFESMIAMADASVFYTEYPKNKYIDLGIPKQKMFVAPNTVEVLKMELKKENKDSILFVGTLLKQKRVDLLLEAYKNAIKKNRDIPVLKIIGEGEEYEPIRQWIAERHLSDKIILPGPIYEEEILKEEFAHALATVSADQAGLTVLKSMGYGVPFITNRNAITGGEIFNIKNGINGVLFDDMSELETILLDIADNPAKYIEMGERAYEYYYSCRTIEDCKDGFIDAIKYAVGESGN